MKKVKQLVAALCAFFALSAFGGVPPRDDSLSVSAIASVALMPGQQVNAPLDDIFKIMSGSLYTVSVSGLPSGVSFNPKLGAFSGAPKKAGVYYVTCSSKNSSGYTCSAISKWVVGGATDGDYDNIGIDSDIAECLEGMRTGELIYICTNMKSISGLPSGVKFIPGTKCTPDGACVECTGFVSGTPKGAAKCKLTLTDFFGKKAVKTVIVKDDGCAWVDVNTAPMSSGRGTVTGSGVKKYGSDVKISAKAGRGYYFAGWYEDEKCTQPFYYTASGGYQKASDSFVLSLDSPKSLYAKFVTQAQDYISFDFSSMWTIDTSGSSDYFFFDIWSETALTVTAKGLPAGVKLQKSSSSYFLEAADVKKLKPGTYTVTLSAKATSGIVGTKEMKVVVPNIESPVFYGLDYSPDEYHWTAGVRYGCDEDWLQFHYDDEYTLTASGLPSGLKLSTIEGFAAISGAPTKPGTYTVTLTAKKGKSVEKATFTLTVDPLPDFAVGTYTGTLSDRDTGDVNGSFTFTAGANGKLSVKVVTAYGTVSQSSPSWYCYDGKTLQAYISKDTSNEEFGFFVTVDPSVEWDCHTQITGEMTWSKQTSSSKIYVPSYVHTAQRNPFSKTGSTYDHPEAANSAAYFAEEYKSMKMAIIHDPKYWGYLLVCADCIDSLETTYGTVTLKMNKNGNVSISGKWEGQTISASIPLVFDSACTDSASSLFGVHSYALFTPSVKLQSCTPTSSGVDYCFNVPQIIPIYWFPLGD